jgi:hypothetical protein
VASLRGQRELDQLERQLRQYEQAARYLDEVARQDAQWVSDQGLLALLTREQWACIEAHLQGEAVSHAQAIEAWAKGSPGDRDDPQSTSGLSDASL